MTLHWVITDVPWIQSIFHPSIENGNSMESLQHDKHSFTTISQTENKTRTKDNKPRVSTTTTLEQQGVPKPSLPNRSTVPCAAGIQQQ